MLLYYELGNKIYLKPEVGAYTHNTSIWEAEAGRGA
jgi:hypothetical protein